MSTPCTRTDTTKCYRNEPRSQVTWGLVSLHQRAQGRSYRCLHLSVALTSEHRGAPTDVCTWPSPITSASSPSLSQMSLNCEYISFRTQGHGRHLDLALRTLALPSLEAPAVEGPWPPISPSVSLTPVADKKRSSWASGHFSSSWLTSTCVTCKMTPRIVRQDSLQAALWGRSIFETQLSQVQKMSPHAFYTMAFPHGHLLEAQQFLLYLICKTKNGPIRSSCAEPTSNICCVITPLVSPVSWNKSTPHWINPIWRQFCKATGSGIRIPIYSEWLWTE